MQNTSQEKSYFYYICYYSLYFDLIIVFINPFSNSLKVFAIPLEYSFYLGLLFCSTYKSLYLYVKKFKLKKKISYKVEGVYSKLFKIFLKIFIFLGVLGLLASIGDGLFKGVSKAKIAGITFLSFTTLWPLLSSVFKKGSNVNKNLFKNGIYFNLACFSARWISLSSALLLPFYEYGILMFSTSFLLAFYFLHVFLDELGD